MPPCIARFTGESHVVGTNARVKTRRLAHVAAERGAEVLAERSGDTFGDLGDCDVAAAEQTRWGLFAPALRPEVEALLWR